MIIGSFELIGARIAVVDISSMTGEDIGLVKSLVSEERLEYSSRFRFEKDRFLTLCAEFAAKLAVSELTGVSPEDVLISGAGEKPKCSLENVSVSISHSGKYALGAASYDLIGADIEQIRPVDEKVAKRFAADSELEYALSNGENFIRLWTLKEAYLKLTGEGITGGLKSVSFDIGKDKVNCSDKNIVCESMEHDDCIVSVARQTCTVELTGFRSTAP